MDYDDYNRMCELEERLYSQIHHGQPPPLSRPALITNYRAPSTSQAGSGRPARPRYWDEPPAPSRNNQRQSVGRQRVEHNKFPPFRSARRLGPPPAPILSPRKGKRAQNDFPPKELKKLLNPFSAKAQKLERVKERRQRAKRSQQQKVICLDDDDQVGDFKVPPAPPPLSSKVVVDEDDDVIEIPVPPPEVVTLEDSDEEPAPPAPAARSHSPSSNSMQSDDFIERHDRIRIRGNESFEPVLTVKPKPRSVSISSEDSLTHEIDDDEEPSTNMPIMKGPAAGGGVDNFYSRLKRATVDSRARSKSFSQDNFNEKEYFDVLTGIIQEQESDSDVDEPVAARDEPTSEKAPTTEDIQLNTTHAEAADIRDSLPAQEKPKKKKTKKQKKPSSPEVVERNGVEAGWDNEMRQFYHESWGGETFSISAVLNPMPRKFFGFHFFP